MLVKMALMTKNCKIILKYSKCLEKYHKYSNGEDNAKKSFKIKWK